MGLRTLLCRCEKEKILKVLGIELQLSSLELVAVPTELSQLPFTLLCANREDPYVVLSEFLFGPMYYILEISGAAEKFWGTWQHSC
jgi:hypothetical protein